MQKLMTSKEMAEVFMKNINSQIKKLLIVLSEDITKKISPDTIEIESPKDLFGQDWIDSLKFGVDTIIENERKQLKVMDDHDLLKISHNWANDLPNEELMGIRTAFAAGFRYCEKFNTPKIEHDNEVTK